MKKEKTILFANQLIVTAHILTIDVSLRSQTFIIKVECVNGKIFKEEIFDEEYSDIAISRSTGFFFEGLKGDDLKKAKDLEEQHKQRVLSKVLERVEQIKKALP